MYKQTISSSAALQIKVDLDSRVPKYKQIIDFLYGSIAKGALSMGEKLPSINEVSENCLLSRDTVEKAYAQLKEQRIIVSVKGKGYYVNKTDLSNKLSILFIMNKLSTYKMRIFNSFVNTIGANAHVDLDIYHCEPSVFTDILETKMTSYDNFIIMPHFRNENQQHMGCTEEILRVIRTIPDDKIIVLDRNLRSLSMKSGRIYQDFTEDIYTALRNNIGKLKAYKKMLLCYPLKSVYPYPKGIVTGFKKFCIEHNFNFEVLDEIYDGMELQLKDLFITIEESDLVNLVKQVREKHFKLGDEIGIISYNDTPLKELLGITVISTDFTKMGAAAAQMILNKKMETFKNNFQFIDRRSV